jgi:hypothetical protein
MRPVRRSLAAALAAAVGLMVAPGAAAAEEVEFAGGVDAIGSLRGAVRADSDANPDNRLGVPSAGATAELRPDLRWDHARFSLFVRPRFAVGGDWLRGGADDEIASIYAAEVIQLYGAWAVSDRFSLAYGVQNYQWGPAEILGPSNRLFHQTGFDTTLLTVWYGLHLVRANLSLGQGFSAVVLVEPTAAPDAPVFQAGDPFTPRAQLKLELARARGDAYLGATAGDGEAARPWFGWYGMWQASEGLSVYADVAHTAGSRAWYPVESPTGPTFARAHLDDDHLFTLAVAGARYTWPGGSDLRLEYVYQEAGWSQAERERAVALVGAAPAAPEVIGPYLAPGLELPGRHYAYPSLRLPELGPRGHLTLHLRGLIALGDGSGLGSLAGEWIVDDADVIAFSLAGVFGPRDGELTRLVRAAGLVAARHSW